MISNALGGLVVDRAGLHLLLRFKSLVWQPSSNVLLKSLGNLPRLANPKDRADGSLQLRTGPRQRARGAPDA